MYPGGANASTRSEYPTNIASKRILGILSLIHDRVGRCRSSLPATIITVNLATKFQIGLPRPPNLLLRRSALRRAFLTSSAKKEAGKPRGSRHEGLSSSVETPAILSRRNYSIQVTSNPNEAMAQSHPDTHRYTSGRWLHRNKAQTEARYIRFDYDALCRKAVEKCPGSQSVVECKKIEGGFNRVFLFTMDDKQTLIARLPFAVAGPARLVIHSEVATIAYSKSYPHSSRFPPTIVLL